MRLIFGLALVALASDAGGASLAPHHLITGGVYEDKGPDGNTVILDAPDGGLRQDQPRFPAVFRLVSAEHRRAWEAVRDTPLAWTMVCTGDIVPGERTGAWRALPDVMPDGGRRISIEDLAAFLLGELRDGRYVRRRVGLAY